MLQGNDLGNWKIFVKNFQNSPQQLGDVGGGWLDRQVTLVVRFYVLYDPARRAATRTVKLSADETEKSKSARYNG